MDVSGGGSGFKLWRRNYGGFFLGPEFVCPLCHLRSVCYGMDVLSGESGLTILALSYIIVPEFLQYSDVYVPGL